MILSALYSIKLVSSIVLKSDIAIHFSPSQLPRILTKLSDKTETVFSISVCMTYFKSSRSVFEAIRRRRIMALDRLRSA